MFGSFADVWQKWKINTFFRPKMKTDSRYWSLNSCQRWEIIAPSSSISYLYIHFLFLFSCQTDINLLSITFIIHHCNFQGPRPAIRNLVARCSSDWGVTQQFVHSASYCHNVVSCCWLVGVVISGRVEEQIESKQDWKPGTERGRRRRRRRDRGCLRCPVFQQEVTNSILSLAFKRLTPLITHYALRVGECLCERDKSLEAAPQFKRGPTPNC